MNNKDHLVVLPHDTEHQATLLVSDVPERARVTTIKPFNGLRN